MTYKYFLIVVSNLRKAILPPHDGLNLRTPLCKANARPLTPQQTTKKINILKIFKYAYKVYFSKQQKFKIPDRKFCPLNIFATESFAEATKIRFQ